MTADTLSLRGASPRSSLRHFDLSDRVIIITGGAGLLGVKHAEAVAQVGGVPIILDIAGERAALAAQEIAQQFGVAAIGVAADITQKRALENLRDQLLTQFGRIDGLINNAANNPKVSSDEKNVPWSRFENFPLEIWQQDIAVGLTGAFLCAQVFGTHMAEQGQGVIVNISSDLGVIAPDQRIYEQPNLKPHEQPAKPVTYSIVKTALLGLTRYLATYWATHGVRVNALCPGGVETDQPDAFKALLHVRIPLGRMAQLHEYQGAIQFLLSDASSYMTGSVLTIDGGRTCW